MKYECSDIVSVKPTDNGFKMQLKCYLCLTNKLPSKKSDRSKCMPLAPKLNGQKYRIIIGEK